jgi:lipoate-protein ligase B
VDTLRTPDRDAAGLAVRDLGRNAYRATWELQKQLVAERHAGQAPDTLLIVEHEPVITVGRGTKDDFLATGSQPAGGLEIVAVERGGQATWHGPGQIVVYPIVKLRADRHDLHGWMRALEEATIRTLAEFGLRAGRREGATGVWIDSQRKLCSIGVTASHWVTWHGLALNHEPDLTQFAAINPCGFDAAVMTSMRRELTQAAPMRGVVKRQGPARAFPPRAAVVTTLVQHLGDTLAPFRESS